MILQERIQIMCELGVYMRSSAPEWVAVQAQAERENTWFIPRFTKAAIQAITDNMLTEELLTAWTAGYSLQDGEHEPKKVGLVLAGNIPLVGFFDMLCVYMSGHIAVIKPSSKDKFLITHLINWLIARDARMAERLQIAERLLGCDAYIATGSNQSGRYFDSYFGKYPHIIRRNRTSVAVLTGEEGPETLSKLAGDIQLYFGQGCRNVTQIWVPEGYDFKPLLEALKAYDFVMDLPAYKHNFDYHLTLLIMSNRYYMSNESIVLTEHPAAFSPVSQVHYQYYSANNPPTAILQGNTDVQCIVGVGGVAPGMAQCPGLHDYADGVDTMRFLCALNE